MKASSGVFWDAELETTCVVTQSSNGDYRCLPRLGGYVFADSACTVEAVVPYVWGIEGRIARAGITRDGTTTYRNFVLGEPATESLFYWKSGANCIESTSLNTAPPYRPPRYVIDELPDSDFAQISFTYE